MIHHIDNHHYVADSARVIGDVRLGANANLWYGVSIRGDVAPVVVGDHTNVQDNAILHCDHLYANVIGSYVTIGHNAIVHGEYVGDRSLIGMGAIVLGHTKIGSRCLIAAGALVPPGLEVPDGHVVMGVPGRVVREINDQEAEYIDKLPEHYVELARKHVESPDDPRVYTDDQLHNTDLLPTT